LGGILIGSSEANAKRRRRRRRRRDDDELGKKVGKG